MIDRLIYVTEYVIGDVIEQYTVKTLASKKLSPYLLKMELDDVVDEDLSVNDLAIIMQLREPEEFNSIVKNEIEIITELYYDGSLANKSFMEQIEYIHLSQDPVILGHTTSIFEYYKMVLLDCNYMITSGRMDYLPYEEDIKSRLINNIIITKFKSLANKEANKDKR